MIGNKDYVGKPFPRVNGGGGGMENDSLNSLMDEIVDVQKKKYAADEGPSRFNESRHKKNQMSNLISKI